MVHVLLSLRLYTYILMLFLSLHFEMIIRNNLFFRHHVENTPQWKWIRRKHEALKTCLLASFSSSNTSLSLLQNLWNLITLLLIYKLFKPKNKLNLLCNKVTRSSSANILIGFMFSHVEVQVRREVRVCVCVCSVRRWVWFPTLGKLLPSFMCCTCAFPRILDNWRERAQSCCWVATAWCVSCSVGQVTEN